VYTEHADRDAHTDPPNPGKVAWTDCSGGFRCGTLAVPLDYSHPEGRTINLALIRKPATSSATRIGSVLVNPGGPGESGIEFLRSDVSSLANLNAAVRPRHVGPARRCRQHAGDVR